MSARRLDPLTLTAVACLVLLVAAPIDTYVAFRFFKEWHGQTSIRYLGPTTFVMAMIAVSSWATLLVGCSALLMRATGAGFLPPGLGLLIIALALLCVSLPMPFFLRLLRER